MKAGLAVMLRALRDVSPKTHRVKVAFGVDEEFYSLGCNVLAASSFMEDVAGIVVPEIGNGPNVSHGPSTIVLGRLGRCEYVITVPGTGGHGAQAFREEFVNAAVECAKIVDRLEKLRAQHRDEFVFTWENGRENDAVSRIRGGFFVNKLKAGEGSLSIPSTGMISVDWEFTPDFKIEEGLGKLQNLIDGMYDSGELGKAVVSGRFRKAGVNLRQRPTPASNAYITAYNHPFTVFAKKVVEKEAGFRNFGMGYSVADENVFRRIRPGIPVLVIGPLGDDSHAAEDWVEIESVRQLENVYTSIAERADEYL
jgi:acetylornithine deacetylase/succinyl-diaminopimelate desuccinylase-like protein